MPDRIEASTLRTLTFRFPRALVLTWLMLAILSTGLSVAQESETASETPSAIEASDEPRTLEIALDEIDVSASYSLNRETPTSGVALSRDQILEIPTFSDDLFRAITLIPGTSGNDVSSAFSIRGAPFENTLVRLDGIELFEPFHLADFSGVLSILDPQTVADIEIYPGAFPATYGDRGAGVVDLTSRTPSDRRSQTGFSLTSLFYNSGGRFGEDDRGSYLTSARRGWLDIVFALVGDDEEEQEEGAPEYTDLYGKIDWRLDERTNLGLWALWADDQLDSSETEEDGTLESFDTSYGNSWLVASAQRLWNDDTVSRGRFFAGRVDRNRLASEAEGESDFDIRDNRQLDIFGFAAETNRAFGERHLVDFGLEARSYRATYDYRVARDFTDPIAAVGSLQPLTTFDHRIDGESFAVWVSDRWRLGSRAVAEIGVRYDLQTWLPDDDDQFSPRLNLVYDLGSKGVLRTGWGLAHQSQRPNELAVEDGDTAFSIAERYEHRSLGWERSFGRWNTKIEAFQRLGTELRPRYVNLFNPAVMSPEGSPDRFRLDADRSRAQGLELFLEGPRSPRLDWWVSYTYSEVEDRTGGVWIPRSTDQTHAFTGHLGYRLGPWKLDAVWNFHTGWPITGVSAELVDGADGPEIQPLLGPLFAERVADYHRLDLRVSRNFQLSRAQLQLYFDIQNLYNRENERGFEFGEDAFRVQPDGSVKIEPQVDTWLGIVPSFGLTWSF